MSAKPPEIDPSRAEARLRDLPGVERLREALAGSPVEAHLVGGGVRDLLLGLERADLDVVVEGDVEELARRLGGTVRSHHRFGTASVEVDGAVIDLARARLESYPFPGALPQVRPATLGEDLARRDFTINAMAVPLTGRFELIDPHGGLGDLGGRLLRVLHPRSFVDDPTRALRAARYAARLGFSLEPATAELLAQARLETVSRERREAELRRLASEPQAPRALGLASDWGLVALDPERLELVDEVAALLAAELWSGVAARADTLVAAATAGLERPRALAALTPRHPSEGVRAAHGHGGVELALARPLGGAWLDRYLAEWRDVRLTIGGADLLAAGVPEGPAVGQGLEAALRAKLDEGVAGREAELRVALAAAGE